eukprot:COSAG01_NODE_435_length_17065_cov_46.870977_3_plen_61_part_00
MPAAGIAPERRAAAARQSATLRALTGVRVLPRRPQPSLERPAPPAPAGQQYPTPSSPDRD